MKQYLERCNISKEECRRVKEEIYRENKREDVADRKWEKIIENMLLLKKAKWYFEDKRRIRLQK